MAELVQRSLEDRLPELEQLERVGLFSRREIKAVIKKASALEYKIHRRALSKEDFVNYVQYEINLLELIKKRRLRIGYSFKKEEIEFSVVQRIHSVFKRATAKWKSDLQLWLSHVAFCKKWNCKTQLSKVFSAMLAIHPDKPALWIMAAKWEMEDRLSSESARHLFLRALRFHPESPKVYQEYFRMELMHAEKQRKEKQELEQAKMDVGELEYSEEILNGLLAQVIYKDAVQKIKGAEFHLSLLSIVKLFDFAQDLQKEILEELQTLHADEPLTWDYMARLKLEVESLPCAEYSSKLTKASDLARKEDRCCAVYEEAISAVPTEAMWKCYVVFCLERFKRKTNSEELKEKRQEKLLAVFLRAHESTLLEEALYKQWVQVLLELNKLETMAEISAVATERFTHSVEMWQMRLQVLMKLKSDNVPQYFKEAFCQVKTKETLPLWTLWVEWSEGANSVNDTEELFQKSILSTNPAVSVTMKEKYIDWAYRTGGYKKAKRVFTRFSLFCPDFSPTLNHPPPLRYPDDLVSLNEGGSLHESRPFSLEFFKKMIQMEKEQEASKMLNLREFYERAVREFGSTNPELWLEYIKEELSHHQGKPENCGQIHWRALKMLQGEQVEEFVSKYALLQTRAL